MISSFFTENNAKEVRDALELRAAQLVTGYINTGEDENLKHTVRAHHCEAIKPELRFCAI